jgi:hypothetical protein
MAEADYLPLIQSVIITAVHDAKGKDTVKALDAVMFLAGDEMPLWLEAAGFGNADPLELLISGHIREIRPHRTGR